MKNTDACFPTIKCNFKQISLDVTDWMLVATGETVYIRINIIVWIFGHWGSDWTKNMKKKKEGDSK